MKVWVIGHPEAVQGFALVGVHGIVAETPESMNQALDAALANEDLGIVMVTDDAAALVQERFTLLTRNVDMPIFLVIPSARGMAKERLSLTDVVNQAIGIQR